MRNTNITKKVGKALVRGSKIASGRRKTVSTAIDNMAGIVTYATIGEIAVKGGIKLAGAIGKALL